MAHKQGKYTISMAAEMAGVHPQTLRDYEKKGVVRPERTPGNTRRYSDEDVARVGRAHRLVAEGVNLSGVEKIVALEDALDELRDRYDRLVQQLGELIK